MVTLGNIYTTVFRGVPELLIIYLIYFGGSSAVTSIGKAMGYEGFLGLPSFLAGALAVGIISGAYQAEVFRGAFQAISKGELEAASAIGMHRALRLRRIIIPQVFRFRHPGHRQRLAAQSQGFSVDLRHRPCRPDAHQPGGGRLDAAVFPVLHRRRYSLSDPHQPFGRVSSTALNERANRSMPTAAMGQADRRSTMDIAFMFETMMTLLKAVCR
jgi:octopine/nopaline transport system permease protein